MTNNEVTFKESEKASGLNADIVKTWMESLEDILATNQEAVEKAKKYDQMKRYVGSLTMKIADLQNIVQLSAVVKKERDCSYETSTFTPQAENVPMDLSVKMPQEEQQQFSNVADMIHKMTC